MNRLAFALSVFCLTHFTGWSQSASLSTGSPFSFECEGGAITVTPTVSGFPGPYSFELNFDGLAPNIVGTDVDLQPSYTVQASTPGVYAFELIATDSFTMVEALPLSFEVGGTVEGSLSLSSLGAGFFEDNISGPTTTFLYCGGVSSVVMDFDIALNGPANSGTAVTIDWGDGTVDNGLGFAVSHNYAPGSWQIAMTVTHPSASLGFPCQQTTVYNVFVGTVPEVSITWAASELCLNNPIAEIVLGNTSLTEVTWDINFSDGSNPITFITSSDEVGLIHTFSSSSCGELIETPFGQLNDGFFMTANAQNACGSTQFENVGPFSVSEPPSLQISSDAGSVVCPNQSIAFTNNSAEPNWTTGNGCSGDYTYRWEIDSDLTLISGDLGSDNGFPGQPEFWSSGNPEIEVTSSTPGVYQIDLIAFSNSACGVDSASFYLNVEASPSCECEGLLPAISLDDVEVCPGELVPSIELPAMGGVTWSWTNDNPTTGLGVSGLGDIPSWIATPNTSDAAKTGTVTVIGQVPGCDAAEVGTYEAAVLPTPTITAIPTDITICSGLSPDVELFLNTDDTLFWTSTWDPEIVGEVEEFGSEVFLYNQFFNTGLNPADVVFTVTVVNALNTNICPFDDEIVTVTVLPGLTPEQFSDVTLCPGEIAAPVALPAIADVTWTWSNDNTTTGLGSGGEGDIPAWEALPNTSDTANTGTVTVIGQLPGCFAAEVGSYQISVLAEGCEVGCVSDMNNNGVCDDEEVLGCTYAFAENYNPDATDDDGSCTVAECEPAEEDACFLEGDLNGDGFVGTLDLLDFLSLFGSEFQDSDGDGLCDELDDCFGVYDECGVCEGPGAIYDCGCEECAQFVECGDPVSYQGYDYATVLIGDQCWFAENLRNELYSNGDSIPSDFDDWQNTTNGAVAIFGQFAGCDTVADIEDCDPIQSLNSYGRLYNWYAVDDARGLCPNGWHIPTDGEWMVMEMALGMSETEANASNWRGSNQGFQMKTDYGWNSSSGSNSSGFSGLPGGYLKSNTSSLPPFKGAGSIGVWWTATPIDSRAWFRRLDDYHQNVARANQYYNLNDGFSVRCIRDAE